jgi:hypothetical protein
LDSISIIYCGGCNEAFDRVALVGALWRRIEEMVGQAPRLAEAGEAPAVQLVVCGCMAMCMAYKQKESQARVCHLIGPGYLNFIETPPAAIVEKIAREFAQMTGKAGDSCPRRLISACAAGSAS